MVKPLSEREPNRVVDSSFKGMNPGSLATFTNTTIQIVADAFESFRESDLSIGNWEMVLWSDPAESEPEQLVPRVFALRSDGLTQEQIDDRQARTRVHQSERIEQMVFAPMRQGLKKPTASAYRPSRLGWERMSIGDRVFIRGVLMDVKRFIAKAVLSNDLPWEFRIIRRKDLDGGSTSRTWEVERIV